ncbi:VWA domain-containing protein [Myxococcus sp. K38C18041901]|uniref:vWA domain-containing protein n=1 Tax=Myxococcus guangdongensis TaxID=2906760 RepID=UPI0020A6DD31|nr:VWA domain-containing protein [Myxococcus guangdongensis]MCP3064086.1 VWA domain-containing protein [Myxococcus guangdongensis]
MSTNPNTQLLPESQRGPAEKLLDLVLSGSAHLWHNRPGLDVGGTWVAAAHATPAQRTVGKPVKPGLFVPAAVKLYRQLLDIHQLNSELMAHFASYALTQTDWRDLKVATCALMLVQQHAGQPVRGDDGQVAFHDDDYRSIGEAMVLHYERKSTRMLTPKAVLRVAELLELPDIASLNRAAGFGDPASRKPPMGRWKRVASRWLAARESNLSMLQGLMKAGYKETLKKLARKAGYKPLTQGFFEVLGWKQKQAEGGHRTVGLSGLTLVKRERFDGLSEAEICEWIDSERLSYKEVVGRLPKDVGMTPAIMVALLPSLSDRDLRLMTPTLEELGLLAEPTVRARWEKAVQTATDQRALNIAKNVRSEVLRQKLEEASDNAARQAVAEATAETDVRVMFLIDKSGSMDGAIENSKEALARILAGFPMEKLHIAAFDTMGTVLRPKASNRTAVQHMLAGLKASGGTTHAAGVHALHRDGMRVPEGAKLVVIVVGDEAGEAGDQFARAFRDVGFPVAAMALLVSVAGGRGNTVRTCASQLRVPFSEVNVDQFADPYQVPRVLKALLDAPTMPGASQSGWVERVMRTPLLKVA